LPNGCREPAQGFQLRLVGNEVLSGWKRAVDEKMSDFLELTDVRDIEDIVSAIVQIVACPADGTQRRISRDDT
jgi:hypothetical protein